MHTLAKRRMKKYFFILSPIIITALLWLYSKYDQGITMRISQTPRYISQLFGLFGIVLLSIDFLIITRIRTLENFFGGLDKLYNLHAQISKIAFILIVAHPLLLVFNSLDNIDFIISLFVPFVEPSSNAKTAGILSLYGFTLLIIITIFRFMPYHIWKWTHMLMGIPFFLAGFHGLYARSDVARSELLRYWIIFWIVIGILAYIYKLVLYQYIGPKFRYKIEEVNNSEDKNGIHEIVLSPQGRRINFEPGEFVYMQFIDHEWISREQHPFSISSEPSKDFLRISYKEFGDYTHELVHHAKKGDLVNIFGPYGEFSSYVFRQYKKQIWIAGGVGVTPFLSMLSYEVDNSDTKDIYFYYCGKNEDQCDYIGEIHKKMKNADDNIQLINHLSSKSGRITAHKIEEYIKGNLEDYLILMCGPSKMMESLKKQFIKKGVSTDMIVFEDFNYI